MAVAAVCAARFVEEAVDEDQPKTMRWMIGLDDTLLEGSQHFDRRINLRQKHTTAKMCRLRYSLHSYAPGVPVDQIGKKLSESDSMKLDFEVPLEPQVTEPTVVHGFNKTEELEFAIAPPLTSFPSLLDPPPSYNDSISDIPPDYTSTTSLASQKFDYTHLPPPPYSHPRTCSESTSLICDPVIKPTIDFSTSLNVRQHANKKQKQAQKKAQMEKWADDDDAGAGGEGGDQNDQGAGGGDGGAGAGGGGDGGNGAGGGDDGWDDVGGGKGKKGKKNKKKNAFSWEDEEEEEKKKKEEEAKKAEEDAIKNVWDNEPVNGGAGAAAGGGEANPDDEWGDFHQAGGKKNKKKNKKGPDPPPPQHSAEPEMSFDNIDLNENGGLAPQLDLNFGLSDKDNKSSSFGFGGGGWGNWGASNASKGWDFANLDDDKKGGDDLHFDTAWGFGSNKKDKDKKKTNDGFDFDFGNIGGGGDLGTGVPEAKPDDEWGAFTSVGKKDKKKKKGGVVDEIPPEPVVVDVPAPPVPASAEVDDWATWGKKDKKKKKGGIDEPPLVPPPPPPPPAPVEQKKEEDDIWANFGPKKDKKKNKKGDFDPIPDPVTAPVSVPEPIKDAEANAADDTWAFGGSKKDKKKAKKAGKEEPAKAEDGKIDDLSANPLAPTEQAADTNLNDDWDAWTAGPKDKKKKGKKGTAPEPEIPPAPPPVSAAVPEVPAEDDWTNWTAGKKDKKKTKKGDPGPVAPPPPPPAVPEAPKGDDDWMNGGIWGVGKKDQKSNKKTKDEDKSKAILAPGAEENSLFPDGVDEPTVTGGDDDWLSGWGTNSATKSKKKGGKKDPLATVEDKDTPKGSVIHPDEVADSGAKDDEGWGIWGTGTRKKDKKKSVFNEPPPPVPTPPDQGLTPEPTELGHPPPPPADNDIWGAFSTAGKKGKKEIPKKETPREKREREKREKEEKEKQEREEKEKAEQEAKEKEEAEKKAKEEAEKKKATEHDVWNFTKPKKETPKERKEREKREKEEREKAEREAKEQEEAERKAQEEAEKKAQEEAERKKATEDDAWGFGKPKKKETVSQRKEREKREKQEKERAEQEAKEKAEQEARENEEAEKKAQEEAELAALEKKKSKDSRASKKEDDDSPAKAVKGFWGSFGTSSSKTKTTKEKEKEKKEKEKEEKERKEAEEAEKARQEIEEADMAAFLDDPIVAIVDEGPPKDSKKKGSKLADSKTKKSSKSKEEPKEDAFDPLIDFLDAPAPPPPPAVDEKPESKKAEGWGFWGSSLKSTKKGASGAADTKKEISNSGAANEKRSLKDGEPEKLLEAADADVLQFPSGKEEKGKNSGNLASSVTFADEVLKKDSAKEKKSSSSKKTSSVADKIKVLQGDKEKEKDKQKKRDSDLDAFLVTDPLATDPTPPPPPPPVATTKSSSKDAKKTSKSSSQKKDKDPSLEPLDVPTDVFPSAPSPIPGGFPLDDLIVDPPIEPFDPAMPVATSKKSPKAVKSTKKDTKSSSKKTTIDSPPLSPPDAIIDAELLDAPVDVRPAESKKEKKERPKISKDQGASSSWGFWGATPTPKKNSKPVKDDASPPKEKGTDTEAELKKTKKSSASKDARPTISRSKSARKATDKDPVDKASRSSGSGEMPSRRESERPKTSRGMSFSGLFGMGGAAAAQPSMARRHSTREKPNRRHSTAVDEGFGIVTPPPDDADADKKERRERKKKEKEIVVNEKAAKVMGIGADSKRRGSVRRKSTVPDPYALDDDIVMVDPAGGEDLGVTSPSPAGPAKRDRPSVSRSKSSKSKRDSKIDSASGGSGDAVLVDPPTPGDILSGPEDLAFVETPAKRPPLKRAATSSARKKEEAASGGIVRGLFGSFRAKPSRGMSDDEYGRDRRRSRAYESADEYGARKKRSAAVEPDSQKRLRRDGRKVERPSRGRGSRYVDTAEEGMTTDAAPREGSASDAEAAGAQRSKRKNVDTAGMSESERLIALRREKERMVRDAKKAKARERVEAAENDIEAQRREERRARRREEEAARREADERRTARRRDSAAYERPKADRRRSSYADKSTKSPDDDAARRIRREERRVRREREGRKEYLDVPNSGPYKADAGDKTSSWVNSINMDPPLPPPDQGTVIDEAITAREGLDDTAGLDGIEDAVMRARRERKKSKRTEGEKRRGDEKTMKSGDSSGDRRRSMYAGYPDPAAAQAPAPAGRRMSWFKGLF